ncbi:MAG: LPS export ABC transporter periplasmic protein LptC [Woeseiaceae bacterium]|nr:LPS export ABC transporter periplasmic protein LptC [Woeseiaceae bacterium]
MNPRAVTLIVFLSAGAIGSWYLSRSHTRTDNDEPPYQTTHYGYYLKQARILGTGENGALLYQIEAELAEQQEDNRIEFTDVRILYSPESTVPWIVNADEATLRQDDPMITLRGHVQIINSGAENDTEIRTQYLELDPEQFIAETDMRVQIRIGERSLTATGMLASLNDDKIELKSNVRGKIAP